MINLFSFRGSKSITKNDIELINELNKVYFDDDPQMKFGEENICTGFKDVTSDATFNVIGSVTAREIAKKSSSPIYEYFYTHQGTIGLPSMQLMKPWEVLLKVKMYSMSAFM